MCIILKFELFESHQKSDYKYEFSEMYDFLNTIDKMVDWETIRISIPVSLNTSRIFTKNNRHTMLDDFIKTNKMFQSNDLMYNISRVNFNRNFRQFEMNDKNGEYVEMDKVLGILEKHPNAIASINLGMMSDDILKSQLALNLDYKRGNYHD